MSGRGAAYNGEAPFRLTTGARGVRKQDLPEKVCPGCNLSFNSSRSGGGEGKASGKSSGGAIPVLGLVGALLVGGGLLIRRSIH